MSENSVAVEPADPSKNTSEITGSSSDEATVSMEMMKAKCYWNDAEFSMGDKVSSAGKNYVCNCGRWVEEE